MKLHHFGIQVSDLDRSFEFYTKKLGFIIKTDKSKSQDNKYYYGNVSLGGAEIELIQILDNKPIRKPEMCPHIALESFDFDKDLEMLKKNGVEIFDGPHVFPGDVKMCTILDPDGYRIDIGQLLK